MQGYVVTPSEGKAVVVIGGGTTTKVKGLTNGTDGPLHDCVVQRTDDRPSGRDSDHDRSADNADQRARRIVSARGVVKVAFDPSDGNGAPVTRYTAICTSSNGGTTRAKAAKTGPITVSGLTPGKSYTCNVRATNDRGNSAFGHSTATKA